MGAPTVQRRRGAALEDAILEAAYDELSEVGYLGFAVENVAARAGTGKASIYRRWPTKQDLVLDALHTRLPSPQQCGIEFAFSDDTTTADALRVLARRIATMMASPDGAVMRAIKCEALTDPRLAQAIDDRFQAPRRAAMLALLQRGADRGEVRPEAVTPLVADLLPSVLTFRILMQREPITEALLTAVMEQLLIPLIEPR